MVITGSNIKFASQHLSVEQYERKESLRVWIGAERPDFEGNRAEEGGSRQKPDIVSLSGQKPPDLSHHVETEKPEKTDDTENGEDTLEPKYALLKQLIEQLTGKKIRLIKPEDLKPSSASSAAGQVPAQTAANGEAQQPQRAGYGVEYDYYESHYESETTSFAAKGTIKTSDGKEISFDLALNMSRIHFEETSVSVRAGDGVKKDPLVINFNGTAAELSDVQFAFDLDADGRTEQIAAPRPGSAFLALDRNGDGKINDGSELFGPKTGSGFAELATLDKDGNGWIDEKDPAFSQLKVWSGGANGTTESLKDAGIGAIYLGSKETPFDIKSSSNTLLGSVKSSGVFVGENGNVGTVQQVDLAV